MKPRALGINHVSLEVGDLDAALAFYGSFLEFALRGRRPGMAWIDLGDQFIALSAGRRQGPDEDRHIGLVVDDAPAVRDALAAAGIEPEPGPLFRVRDPWSNVVEIVDYREVQFMKTEGVLEALGADGLEKDAGALEELRAKGLERRR